MNTVSVGDRLGCVTVLALLTAEQAGKATNGAHALVRCDCLLEKIIRIRGWRSPPRCGVKCEFGRPSRPLPREREEWSHCRNPLCGKELNPGGRGRPNRTGFCNPCKNTPVVSRWYVNTRQGAAEARIQSIKRNRKRRAERRKKGLCVQCGVPCQGMFCGPHKTSSNENHSMWRVKRIRAGICGECRRIAVPGRKKCAKHLAGDAKRSMARYWRKIEQGRVAA